MRELTVHQQKRLKVFQCAEAPCAREVTLIITSGDTPGTQEVITQLSVFLRACFNPKRSRMLMKVQKKKSNKILFQGSQNFVQRPKLVLLAYAS